MKGLQGPPLHVTAVFGVPLAYAFRWCTDFRPDDARREKESFRRKIVERSARRVVYEDLSEGPHGWRWARYDVRLKPPARWVATSIGNIRDASLDYRLTALGPSRTRLDLTWRRAPHTPAAKAMTRTVLERDTTRSWKNFASEMEKDYRRSRRR